MPMTVEASPQSLKGVALVQLSRHTWYLVTMRVFFQGSVENLAAMRPDVLFIVHAKDSAFPMGRIQSYMLFFFHCNNNDAIMHSWFVSAHNSDHNGVIGIFVGHC